MPHMDTSRAPQAGSDDKALRKYLARHAEPEAAAVLDASFTRERYGHVLCIPAYGEGRGVLDTLASVPEGPRGSVLIILVVNETGASPEWVRAANRASLASLQPTTTTRSKRMWLHEHVRGDLVVVDRTAAQLPLPDDQGVGLARKIGADMALAMWAAGAIASPWIHCTDADASLPPDYFARPLAPPHAGVGQLDAAACVYDFRHLPESDPETARAALRYEIFLRYLVLGLRSAASPYAFHNIGSTLALSPLAYARARGFPRRQAAEDFHLLAKLAKLGPIRPLRGEPISLSSRVSSRVPFGTGAAVARGLERARRGAFHPMVLAPGVRRASAKRSISSIGNWIPPWRYAENACCKTSATTTCFIPPLKSIPVFPRLTEAGKPGRIKPIDARNRKL